MSIGIGSSWDEDAEDDWDAPPIGAPIHDDDYDEYADDWDDDDWDEDAAEYYDWDD